MDEERGREQSLGWNEGDEGENEWGKTKKEKINR